MNLLSNISMLYIDPSVTGQIIYIVAGIFITLGVMLGVFRTKITAFFQRKKIARMEKKIAKESSDK